MSYHKLQLELAIIASGDPTETKRAQKLISYHLDALEYSKLEVFKHERG